MWQLICHHTYKFAGCAVDLSPFRNDGTKSASAKYLPDGRNANLVFHIVEGIRYRLKEAPTVVGSARVPRQKELDEVLKVRANDWYDGPKLKRGEAEIRDWYGFQGYDVRVQAVPYFSKEQPGLVTVRYEVDDGRRPAR